MKLIITKEQCVGCRQCEAVCSAVHTGSFIPRLSRITIERDEGTVKAEPVICRQCGKARCLEACPAGAIKPDENNILTVDKNICTGCMACIEACPFNAMKLDYTVNAAIKCDLCGGDPQCVKVCPAQVITVG